MMAPLGWVLLALLSSLQGGALGWLLATRGSRKAIRRSAALGRLVRHSAEKAELLALNAAIVSAQAGGESKAMEAFAAGARELASELRASGQGSESGPT